MFCMLLFGIAIDQDVIQVSRAEVVQVVPHGFIDIILENTRGLTKPKGHDQLFKLTVSGIECGYISNSGKRARPPPPSAAIPSVWPRVPLTAALLRATPRYLALSPTITTTEDLISTALLAM